MSRRARVIVFSALGGLFLVAAVVYLIGYSMASEKTPANASVNGIAIGSMTETEAVSTLKAGMEANATKAVQVAGDGKSAAISPVEAGMTVNYAATVKQAGAGKSWNPVHIWSVLRGGGPVTPVLSVDDAKVQQAVAKAAPTFAVTAKDASLAWQGTTPTVTPGVQAVSLDTAATAKSVSAAWKKAAAANSTVAKPLEASLVKADPGITTAEATTVANQAKLIAAAPITVKLGTQQISITPQQLVAATTFTPKDGTITVATDMAKVWAAAQPAIKNLDFEKARDARIILQNGQPTVVPSVDGKGVKQADFVKVVQPALATSGAARTVSVPVTNQPAEFTTAMAQKVGVKEVTGEFTTYFPYAEYRNNNLSRAAASINNTYVKPGGVFSLNATLGERTAGNGYVDGYVIQGNKLKKEPGGGVSQSATTVYNAIFFAGLQDIEHHPHTLYFDRYPAGREATVYYGALDLRFGNNTPYGVLMQAYVNKAAPGTKGSITVKVWSTKVWDKVESSDLVKSNWTYGQDLESNAADCEPQSPSQGFDVNYSRIFWKNGQIAKTEKFFWRYSPTDQIKCTR